MGFLSLNLVNAVFNCYSHNLGGERSDDEWSRDSYLYNWIFSHLVSGDGEHSCAVKDLDKNKLLYVVYVVYSTGDSFGYDENARLELIHITHDPDLAYKIKEFIENDNKNQEDYDIYKTKANIDGVEFYTYPWKGYFENLSYVRVECDKLR